MNYEELNNELETLIKDVPHLISNLSNASALLNECLDNVNWVGFYLYEKDKLVLGPFQGKVACIEIPYGKGVCGTALERKETILVKNVHEFPGHIACDNASNSEIVIPIMKDDEVFGVLDIDSPLLNRFSIEDKLGLEEFVKILEKHLS